MEILLIGKNLLYPNKLLYFMDFFAEGLIYSILPH